MLKKKFASNPERLASVSPVCLPTHPLICRAQKPASLSPDVQKTSAVHFDTALPDNKSQSSTQDFESMHKSLDRLNARRQKQDYSSDEEV